MIQRITAAVLVHKNIEEAAENLKRWEPGLAIAKASLIVLVQEIRNDKRYLIKPLIETFNQYTPDVRMQISQQNIGVAGGRLRLTDFWMGTIPQPNDLIVFVDSDVIPNDDQWIKRLVAPLTIPQANKFDQPQGICGAYGIKFSENMGEFSMIQTPRGICHAVAGYCMACKADIFFRGCEFDQRYNLFWHEDIDLCMQALSAGYGISCWINDDLKIQHIGKHKADDAYTAKFKIFTDKWANELFKLSRS